MQRQNLSEHKPYVVS